MAINVSVEPVASVICNVSISYSNWTISEVSCTINVGSKKLKVDPTWNRKYQLVIVLLVLNVLFYVWLLLPMYLFTLT